MYESIQLIGHRANIYIYLLFKVKRITARYAPFWQTLQLFQGPAWRQTGIRPLPETIAMFARMVRILQLDV